MFSACGPEISGANIIKINIITIILMSMRKAQFSGPQLLGKWTDDKLGQSV